MKYALKYFEDFPWIALKSVIFQANVLIFQANVFFYISSRCFDISSKCFFKIYFKQMFFLKFISSKCFRANTGVEEIIFDKIQTIFVKED